MKQHSFTLILIMFWYLLTFCSKHKISKITNFRAMGPEDSKTKHKKKSFGHLRGSYHVV